MTAWARFAENGSFQVGFPISSATWWNMFHAPMNVQPRLATACSDAMESVTATAALR